MTTEYSIAKLTEMLQAKGIRPSAQRIGGARYCGQQPPPSVGRGYLFESLEALSVAIAHNGLQFPENADRERIAARIGD